MNPKIVRGITWTSRILLALAFTAAAFGKLASDPKMVAMFDKVGFGQWFRYFTGLTELSGAILLLIPATAFWGALILVATMAGAIATHLLIIGGSPLAAIVLGVLASFAAYRLRGSATGSAREQTQRQTGVSYSR